MKQLFSWLREAALNIGQVLLWIGLFILAILLLFLLPPAAVAWKIYVTITKENRTAREILSGTGAFYKALSLGIDQLGNAAYGGMFNDLLIKDISIFPFGNPNEKISSVLGWNLMLGDNMTQTGKKLVAVIEWCDISTEKHCIESAAKELEEAMYKVQRYETHLSNWRIKSKAS